MAKKKTTGRATSKANESQADESQADEPQADEPQADEPQTDESQTDESQTDESQTNESQTNESKPLDARTIIGLIDSEWADLHHSRNQDWKFWLVLTAVGAGLVGIEEDQEFIAACLCVVGFLVSFVAALICVHHSRLHLRKIARIKRLEECLAELYSAELGDVYPFESKLNNKLLDKWSVSNIIFSTYATLASGFFLGPLWPVSWRLEELPYGSTFLLTVVVIAVFVFWSVVFYQWRSRTRRAIAGLADGLTDDSLQERLSQLRRDVSRWKRDMSKLKRRTAKLKSGASKLKKAVRRMI